MTLNFRVRLQSADKQETNLAKSSHRVVSLSSNSDASGNVELMRNVKLVGQSSSMIPQPSACHGDSTQSVK